MGDGSRALPHGDDGRGRGVGPARQSGGWAWPVAARLWCTREWRMSGSGTGDGEG
jgi:hypothetical protein